MAQEQTAEMVNIRHSDTGGTGRVPRSALDRFWSKKGWTEDAAAAPTEPVHKAEAGTPDQPAP